MKKILFLCGLIACGVSGMQAMDAPTASLSEAEMRQRIARVRAQAADETNGPRRDQMFGTIENLEQSLATRVEADRRIAVSMRDIAFSQGLPPTDGSGAEYPSWRCFTRCDHGYLMEAA